MINCAYYIDYPVPALLYDAERGNTHSRLLIFDYFAVLTERGQDIPKNILKFVAKQLRMVVDEKQTPKEMFNPEGKKGRTYNPLISNYITLFNFDGDIKARFEKIGEIEGKSGGAIERQYYEHKKYTERLSSIQDLLDNQKSQKN